MADTHTHTHTHTHTWISSGSSRNQLQTAYKVLVTYVTDPDMPGKKADQFVHLRDVKLRKNLLFKCKVLVTC